MELQPPPCAQDRPRPHDHRISHTRCRSVPIGQTLSARPPRPLSLLNDRARNPSSRPYNWSSRTSQQAIVSDVVIQSSSTDLRLTTPKEEKIEQVFFPPFQESTGHETASQDPELSWAKLLGETSCRASGSTTQRTDRQASPTQSSRHHRRTRSSAEVRHAQVESGPHETPLYWPSGVVLVRQEPRVTGHKSSSNSSSKHTSPAGLVASSETRPRHTPKQSISPLTRKARMMLGDIQATMQNRDISRQQTRYKLSETSGVEENTEEAIKLDCLGRDCGSSENRKMGREDADVKLRRDAVVSRIVSLSPSGSRSRGLTLTCPS